MAVGTNLEYIGDLLADHGAISIKRMFGGAGLFCNDLMFALETAGVVYFKADDTNRPDFEKAGTRPFSYEAKGKLRETSYWRVPDDVVAEPDDLRSWGVEAIEASRRVSRKKRRR